MDKDQMNGIKRRNVRTDAQIEWFSIYRILFPHADVPPGPYAYADGQSVAAVQAFCTYFQEEAPMMLSELFREFVRPRLCLSQQSHEILDEAFEHATSRLFLALRPRIEALGSSQPTIPESEPSHSLMQTQTLAETGAGTDQLPHMGSVIDLNELYVDFDGGGWPGFEQFV